MGPELNLHFFYVKTINMKRLPVPAIAVIMIIFISSCVQKNSNEDRTTEKKSEPDSEITVTINTQDTISLYKFNKWKTAWNTSGASYMNSTLTEYFTLPLVDLTELLGEDPAQSRFYLGLDESVTPNVPHLMVVGVDSRGNDMIDYASGQYVYDVSKPCPTDCN